VKIETERVKGHIILIPMALFATLSQQGLSTVKRREKGYTWDVNEASFVYKHQEFSAFGF